MRIFLISVGCWLAAVLIVVALLVLSVISIWARLLSLCLLLWSLVHARRVRLWRYSSVEGYWDDFYRFYIYFPGVWPLFTIWHLAVILRVWFRVAKLQPEYRPWSIYDNRIGPNGLIQPWKGRRL